MSKKTLETAKKTKNQAIIQVKKNQEQLFNDCKKIALNQTPLDQDIQKEQSRNRIDYRKVTVFQNIKFTEKIWNDYINAVVWVRRDTEKFNTKTKKRDWSFEDVYYVSTKIFSAEKFNGLIRGHWGIENRNHYVKDVSMNEDNSRIRKNPQNMARLRSFALNLMRINKSKNIKRDLYKNTMNIDRVLNYECLLN